MKIILTRPSYDSHIITPPLSLGCLSSILCEADIEVKIIDGLRLRMPPQVLARAIARENPDAVGITCLTAYYNEVVNLSRELKKYQIRVIVGGAHPTFLPADTLTDSRADFVICGEGDIALLQLARNKFKHDNIRGVYAAGDLAGNRKAALAVPPDNLDDLPFADWPKIPPSGYPKAPHGAVAKNYPVGMLATSRGCPGQCSFCAAPSLYGKKIRFRSADSVAAEALWQINTLGVQEIQIEDDNFATSRSHVENICRVLSDLPGATPWTCPSGLRADCVDGALLQKMKKAGCYMVAFGVESASNEILARNKKKETIEQIENAINLAHQVGLVTQGYFVFGLPGETRASIKKTIRFAAASKLDRAQFLILDVLPGSELWETLDFKPNWGKKSFAFPEWVPPGLSREMLIYAQKRAFWAFYRRPRRSLAILRMMKIDQAGVFFQRFASFHLLSPEWRPK